MEIEKKELITINGGAYSIGTVINSITKIINTVLELGRTVGSTFRYAKNKYMCR
jgi:hypothetical protein